MHCYCESEKENRGRLYGNDVVTGVGKDVGLEQWLHKKRSAPCGTDPDMIVALFAEPESELKIIFRK